MSHCSIPTIKLNNGLRIPQLGLGTWQVTGEPAQTIVTKAIEKGLRHIDTAYVYGNEAEVGKAIHNCINAGIVRRSDVWVTTKLWNTFHRPADVAKGLERSLRKLQLDYVDLFLMHYPVAFAPRHDVITPKDRSGRVLGDDETDFIQTWKAMEELYQGGRVRAIGVSNFNKEQLRELLAHATVLPAVNQIECHPWLPEIELLNYCFSQDIHVEAYSPLGSTPEPGSKEPRLLEDPVVGELARKYGRTPAQILLRYHVDRASIVLAKTTKEERITENCAIFSFHLEHADVERLNRLDRGYRFGAAPAWAHLRFYPFATESSTLGKPQQEEEQEAGKKQGKKHDKEKKGQHKQKASKADDEKKEEKTADKKGAGSERMSTRSSDEPSFA